MCYYVVGEDWDFDIFFPLKQHILPKFLLFFTISNYFFDFNWSPAKIFGGWSKIAG